jgi:prevent-host-death family protein
MPRVAPVVPVSDWRNKTAEMTRLVEQTDGPVYVTVNGRSRIVCLSIENYEAERFESEIYAKLKEAEAQRDAGLPTLSHNKVMADLRARKKNT